MTRVVLGNRNAVHSLDDGETLVELPKGKRATVVDIADDLPTLEAALSVVHPKGVWPNHATEGATPAWVASDDPVLAAVLASHFGGIEVRDLLDPYDPETAKPKKGGGGSAAGAALAPMLTVLLLGAMLLKATPFLRTNGGADFQATQMAGSASATAVAKFMAVTANTTAESAADTTLTGEITTAGGGLLRQTAVYAHTTGASSYTLTGTFTANGSDTLPVTLGKMGVFTASSGGTMVFEKLLTTTATLSASGDSVVITQTVSI